jgi:hypothetical protein
MFAASVEKRINYKILLDIAFMLFSSTKYNGIAGLHNDLE